MGSLSLQPESVRIFLQLFSLAPLMAPNRYVLILLLLTLEQHEFEHQGSTYMQNFFNKHSWPFVSGVWVSHPGI